MDDEDAIKAFNDPDLREALLHKARIDLIKQIWFGAGEVRENMNTEVEPLQIEYCSQCGCVTESERHCEKCHGPLCDECGSPYSVCDQCMFGFDE